MPFTDPKILMHVAKCRLTTEERKKDERFPVFAVGLVREPVTYSQAKQLGPEVLGHCFTEKKAICDGLTDVTVQLDRDEQRLIAYMAEDDQVGEHCQVRIVSVKITERDTSEDGAETKSKKVGPQQPVLRATFACLMDPAEPVIRDFLALNFAKSFFFTFEDEQTNLFTGVPADDDQGDDEPLPFAGARGQALDDDAGDVLDEADPRTTPRTRKKKASATPKLVKSKKVPGASAGAEA